MSDCSISLFLTQSLDGMINWRNSLSEMAQFSSVTQSCPTLCNPMNHSTPGLPVHHQLPEFTQTHVHWVSDAIQPYYPLSSPSPSALSLFQHQGLFKWIGSSHNVAKGIGASASVLPMNIWDWFPLGLTGLISLLVKGLSIVFSRPTVQQHQFFVLSLFYDPNLTSILLLLSRFSHVRLCATP